MGEYKYPDDIKAIAKAYLDSECTDYSPGNPYYEWKETVLDFGNVTWGDEDWQKDIKLCIHIMHIIITCTFCEKCDDKCYFQYLTNICNAIVTNTIPEKPKNICLESCECEYKCGEDTEEEEPIT